MKFLQKESNKPILQFINKRHCKLSLVVIESILIKCETKKSFSAGYVLSGDKV